MVERSISWLHQFRKLKVREERSVTTHQALIALAMCLICHRFVKT